MAVLALLQSQLPEYQRNYLHSGHGKQGLTALHIAAFNNRCKVAALLLNAGVPVSNSIALLHGDSMLIPGYRLILPPHSSVCLLHHVHTLRCITPHMLVM